MPSRTRSKTTATLPNGSSRSEVVPKASPAKKRPIQRRDAPGHIDPRYARELLAKARETRNADDDPDAAHAFLKNTRAVESLAEQRGESFVATVTSGEGQEAERHDEVTPDEVGGPFVVTTAGEEFATGTDESNIAEADREPLPRTSKAEP